MKIEDLKVFADEQGIALATQNEIIEEAAQAMLDRYQYSEEDIKRNFDKLIFETEEETHKTYRRYERDYGKRAFELFTGELVRSGTLSRLEDIGEVMGSYFPVLDKFFLSLAQSRKTRAGKAFEKIHNSLFERLGYPFDKQVVINGKPDFLMPSKEHYKRNPMDCIIFTAKRTVRERWRQIVTEGTHGLGFYLATIDSKVSQPQLKEMLEHRIYLVCPRAIKQKAYSGVVNVLSFSDFFKQHLDPKIRVWRQNRVI